MPNIPPHLSAKPNRSLGTRTSSNTDDSRSNTASSPLPATPPSLDVYTPLATQEPSKSDTKQAPQAPNTSQYTHSGLHPCSSPSSVGIPIPHLSSGSSSPATAPCTPLKLPDENEWIGDEEAEVEITHNGAGSTKATAEAAMGFDWLPITMSKYTTGVVTTYGWTPVKNAHWDLVRPNANSGFNSVNSPVGRRAWSGEEYKLGLEEANVDDTETDAATDLDMSWLNEKYFDYDGYVRHVRGEELATNGDQPSDNDGEIGLGLIENIDEPSKQEIAAKDANESYTNSQSSYPTGIPETVDLEEIAHGLPTQSAAGVVLQEAERTPSTPSRTKPNTDSFTTTDTDSNTSEFGKNQKGIWELLEGDTESPRVGQPAPKKLLIRLRNKQTGEIETKTFQKLSHDFIDWNNKTQIREISKWRCQIFRRRGFTSKKPNTMYLPEEDAWLILFHQKIKGAVEAGHIIKIPGPTPIAEALNDFFGGRVVQDTDGEDMAPREARDDISLKGKLGHINSGIKPLRDVTRKLLEGKKATKMYVPVITEQDLRNYFASGTIVVDDPNDTDKNAAPVEGTRSTGVSPKRKRNAEGAGHDNGKRQKVYFLSAYDRS